MNDTLVTIAVRDTAVPLDDITEEQYRRALFAFSRRLKDDPALEAADFDTLRPLAARWHEESCRLSGQRPGPGGFDDNTWPLFRAAWSAAAFPASQGGTLAQLWGLAGREVVELAGHLPYDPASNTARTAALCVLLQRHGKTFWLAERALAAVAGISKTAARRCLLNLMHDKVIHREKAGERGEASEFVCLPRNRKRNTPP